MATFQYIAKDSSGAEKRGTIEAADRNAAIAAVRSQGLMPTALGEVKGTSSAPQAKKAKAPAAKKAKGGALNKEIKIDIKLPKWMQGKIKTKVLTQFTRQLATLVNAGLPLMRGLEVLKRQMKDPQMKEALDQKAQEIASLTAQLEEARAQIENEDKDKLFELKKLELEHQYDIENKILDAQLQSGEDADKAAIEAERERIKLEADAQRAAIQAESDPMKLDAQYAKTAMDLEAKQMNMINSMFGGNE